MEVVMDDGLPTKGCWRSGAQFDGCGAKWWHPALPVYPGGFSATEQNRKPAAGDCRRYQQRHLQVLHPGPASN